MRRVEISWNSPTRRGLLAYDRSGELRGESPVSLGTGAIIKSSRFDNPLGRLWHFGFRQRLPLEHETALFILVNVLDFATTYYMLMHRDSGNASFIESNPVARYFLDHWGLRGLLWFKMAVVLFVCVIAQIVATRKIATARLLLIAGTIIVSVVVVYSLRMFLHHV